jgi:ATP-dependent DNA helicase DinG
VNAPEAGPDPRQELNRRREWLAGAFATGGALEGALPGFRPRPGQEEMALAVFDAIVTRGTLVAEAGTGTGKTLAYLLPALAAGGKVLVCAATRALQDQIFRKDLPAARAAWDTPLRVALLKGRQNYVCRLRLERTRESGMLRSRAEVEDLAAIARFADRSESGDRGELESVPEGASIWPAVTSTRDNCLGAQCTRFEECFVVRARRRAQAADVVVVNHHLLLADMSLRETGESELLPRADTLVVDEAHHLARIAAEFFGEDWSLQEAIELGADARRIGLQSARDGAPWVDLCRSLERAARDVRLALAPAGSALRARQAWEPALRDGAAGECIEALLAALASISTALESNRGREDELDLLGPRTLALRGRIEPWREPLGEGSDCVQWVALTQSGARFHATPLRCDDAFARAREARPQAWIFTSATLTSAGRFGPFVEALGLQGCTTRAWESPFDFARQGLLYLPLDMPQVNAPGFGEQVAACAWPLVRASHGRAFVLCSTLRAVADVARFLRGRIGEEGSALRVHVQGEAPRLALLDRFRDGEPSVLVGSMSFWEGIDVRGEALSLVVIDKLPFAPPDDPLVAARIARLREQGRNPFSEYQLPETITMLRQGAGRLLRDAGDRGVLCVLDGRLLARSYGKTILASLPPFRRTRSEEEACEFLRAAPDPA